MKTSYIILLLITNFIFNSNGFSQGDNCSSALTLTNVSNYCSGNGAYTNVGSTPSTTAVASCWTGSPLEDVWFSFTATGTDVLISVTGSSGGGTMIRPRISLYAGACTSLTELGCANGTSTINTTQLYEGGLILGQTYLMRISTTNANEGTFQLCVNNYNPPVSASADCGGAGKLCNKNPISVPSLSGGGANTNEPESTSCMSLWPFSSESNSVWYTWTCGTSGTLLFDLMPTDPTNDLDFILYQLSGTNPCGPRTIIRCTASACLGTNGYTGLNATDTQTNEPLGCTGSLYNGYCQYANMTAGTSYALLINNANGNSGFNINWGGTGTFAGPDPNIVATATTICAGETINFDGSTSTGYTSLNWTFNNTGSPTSLTGAGLHTVIFNNPGNFTAILQASVTGCSSIESQNIIVNPSPTVTAIANSSLICEGSSSTLTASGANTYTWSSNAGNATTSSVSVSPGVGTNIYTVTGTSNGCTNTQTVSVTVNPTPTPTATTTGTLTCSTPLVVLNSTLAGVNYTWTAPTGGSVGSANTQSTSVSIPGTYTLNVSTAAGCTYSTTTTITQSTIAPTGINAGSNGTLTCVVGNSVNLNGSVTTPTNAMASWTGTNFCGNQTNTFTTAACSAGVYTLTATNPANGCTASSTVQVFPSAGAPSVTNNPVTNSITCTNTLVTVSISTTATPVSYNWTGTGIIVGAGTDTITVNQSGTFDYTVTNTSNGCIATGSQAVTQNTVVPSLTVSGTQTITCSAPTVTLTGSATPLNCTPVWTGGVTSGANSYTAIAAAANNYTLTVTDPDNGCVNSATTQVMSSSGIPVIIATVTNSLTCTTLTSQVIASTTTTPVTYNWSGTGITGGAGTASITVNQPGTFNYTVTNTSNGCVTMGSQAVTQNTTIPTLTVSGTQTITCGAPSVTLVGSATPSACIPVWTGGVASGANSYTATAASPNIYTLTVTDPDNGCVNSATTQVVPSVGMPSVNTSVTNSLSCTVTSAQVIATTTTSPVSYNWTGPGITGGASTATATVNNAGTYTVVVTNTSTACSSTITIGVTQNTVSPIVSTNTSGVLNCTLTSVNVIGTTTATPVSYNWSGTGIMTGAGTETITVNQPGTFNYTVTNTDNGCATMGSQTVTQNTVAPSVTASASNPTICSMGSSTLTASGAATYTWSSVVTLNSANGSVVTASPGITETYTVVGAIGTCTNSVQVTVNVASNPVVAVQNNTTICLGSSAFLIASGANTYTWSPAVNLSVTTGANVNANPFSTQTYSVVGASALGCKGTTTVMVTVIPNPTITVSASPMLICEGSSTTLNANGASSYTWTPATNVTNPNSVNTTASPVITTIYTVTGTNGTSPYLCSSTKTLVVNVQPKTVVSTFTADPICYGSSTTIYANGGNSYTWTPLSGGVDTPFDSVTIVRPLVTTIYTVTVAKNGLCPGTGTVEVIVNPLPIVNAGMDTIINIDESVLLQGTGNVAVGFLSTDANPLNCNLCPSIIVQPQDNRCYTLKGTNSFGCTSFDEVCVTVTKDYGVYIPNAFTPNGDGLNELFMPAGYAIQEMKLSIFDRWGKEIFKSDDTHPGWDGTYSGQLCKQDVYVYRAVIKAMSGKSMIKVGHVTLLPKLK